eukprot:scaffold422_cov399-Prasinococcus_capsulatus_cf.AAC.9
MPHVAVPVGITTSSRTWSPNPVKGREQPKTSLTMACSGHTSTYKVAFLSIPGTLDTVPGSTRIAPLGSRSSTKSTRWPGIGPPGVMTLATARRTW